jgi:hypothetical protein
MLEYNINYIYFVLLCIMKLLPLSMTNIVMLVLLMTWWILLYEYCLWVSELLLSCECCLQVGKILLCEYCLWAWEILLCEYFLRAREILLLYEYFLGVEKKNIVMWICLRVEKNIYCDANMHMRLEISVCVCVCVCV